jgi:lipopolysaccharide export system protein LptA
MYPALRALMLAASLGPITFGMTLPALAQTTISLTGLQQDTSLPVEVEADSLSVDQASEVAIFTGNVRITQGEMTITASEAQVDYLAGGGGIERLRLKGRVLFTSPTDAAESDDAVYTIATGEVVMTGDVLLTQGTSTIAGSRLVYNLDAGTGTMEGRVQTVFVPGKATP